MLIQNTYMNIVERLKTWFAGLTQQKKIGSGVVGVVLIAFAVFFILHKGITGNFPFFTPQAQYQVVYELVSDKISQHSGIVVNLPDGTKLATATTTDSVSFTPQLTGSWIETKIPKALVYKPAVELKIGSHYQVSLATTDGVIKKDFIVDEDPKISSVFPNQDAEAELHSAITISFNRPMVPLTTLSVLDGLKVPVTITPATKGKFKWISTRTLQFVPETALIGSTNYAVTVGSQLVSMDGLAVPPATYHFATKALRLNYASQGTLTYSAPMRFQFNQPVDLEKTKPGVRLLWASKENLVPLVRYGKRIVSDSNGKAVSVEDKTVLEVLPSGTLHGNNNVWDFESAYQASIDVAYPIGGEIVLRQPSISQIITTPAIESVKVDSPSTTLGAVDLFDPNGTTTVNFYEDIDIGKSDISVKGLADINYGEKCAGVEQVNKYGYYGSYGAPCEKVSDHSQLVFTFDSGAKFKRGEQVPITFSKIVNAQGFQINKEPITVLLTVYPELQILRTAPADKQVGGSLREFVICTTVPLKEKDAADFSRDVKSDRYLSFERFNPSYRVDINRGYNEKCNPGEYSTRIYYGLIPLKPYSITMQLEDVFGAATTLKTSFTAENASTFSLDIRSMQKVYNVTAPEHTKLTYAAENFPVVQMSICKLDPKTMVDELTSESVYSSSRAPYTAGCLVNVKDDIAVPQEQWVYHYFQIDLAKYFKDTRGQYRITLTHPQYTDYQGRQTYSNTYVSVTNLAVVEKRVQWYSDNYYSRDAAKLENKLAVPDDTRGVVYFATNSGTLAPIAGATVRVYTKNGTDAPLDFGRIGATDIRGLAEFSLTKNVAGAVITSPDGVDSAIVTSWGDTLDSGAWGWARDVQRTYLYTDRPIYRPGQEVFFKGIYRINYDGFYKKPSEDTMAVEISDSKGAKVLSQNLPVSDFGTFGSSLKLPADAALGAYYISAGGNSAVFTVSAYAAAAFDAQATADKDEYVSGDTATLDIAAKYYFGAPLDGGSLSWSLTTQDYHFDRYSDANFSFGRGWYTCESCNYGDTYLKSGTADLDQNGKAQVKQALDFSELFKKATDVQSKIFVFHGTIKDKQGKSVSFQKSFIVHRGEFYLGIKADPSFVPSKTPFNVLAKTVDVTGKPTGELGLSYTIGKVSWQSFKRQEVDGGFYNRSERVVTPVITKSFRTDGTGDYSDEVTLSEPGEYEISATGTDRSGNEITAKGYVYAYGDGQVDVRQTNNATLDLKADKTDVKVGDTARLVIQNPFPRAKALVSVERGRIFSYEVLDITDSIFQYSFRVTDDHVPNVYAAVVLLAPGGQMKFGNLQFNVNRDQKKLSIEITTNKTSYLPGEQVTLTVKTTDALGRAVPANVSVAVADLSVLALSGNPKKNPLVFFYDGFPLTVSTEANTKNLLTETPIPSGTKGGSGGGGDGLANKVRGEFKDTAFWRSDAVTNAAGVATMTFTLPDNLTKWQVESVGITKDTLVGASYKEVIAQKQLMAVPIIPRFVVPGDEFMVGLKIFNQTNESQPLNASIKSATLKLVGASQKSLTIAAGKTETVYFPVVASATMDRGVHTLTLSAQNEDFNDTVEQRIPITRNMTYEATATANGTTDATSKEYLFLPGNVIPDQGGLTIKTSATLALYLTDALTYMFQYPYGCSEQIASKLRAIAIAKRVLTLPNVGKQFVLPKVQFDGKEYSIDDAVAIGMKQMLDNQNGDGGFTYYKWSGAKSDPALTATVLQSLMDLRAAGYSVSQNVIDLAVNYSYNQIGSHTEQYYRDNQYQFNEMIAVLSVLQRIRTSSVAYGSAVRTISNIATQSYISDKMGSMTLGTLALLTADPNTSFSAVMKTRAFAALQNRVAIDSRGAYVAPREGSVLWTFYETREKDSALLLEAVTIDKREYTETDNLIRSLMASRTKDGSWGSTNTTATVLNALAKYLEWKRELSSQFTLDTLLDGKSLVKSSFGPDNILKPIETFLATDKIALDKLHLISFAKENQNKEPNKFYYDLSLKYFLPANLIPPRDEGFTVTRNLYALTDTTYAKPLTTAKVGDIVRGVVTIVMPKYRHFVALEDAIPAGFELVDFKLKTEDQSVVESQSAPTQEQSALSSTLPVSYDESVPPIFETFYPDFEELRDDRVFAFEQSVKPGTYTYTYYLRATVPGTFRYLPAVVSEMYYPENFGRNGGSMFTVEQ